MNHEVLSVQAHLEPKKEEEWTKTRRHGARTRPSPRPTADLFQRSSRLRHSTDTRVLLH